jgi:hypothetical protein
MTPLSMFSIALSSFSGVLLLGFLTAAFPDLRAFHLIVCAGLVSVFVANGLSQSKNYYSFNAKINPLLVNFIGRAIVVVAFYLLIVAIGHWLYIPEVSPDELYL